MPLGVSRRTFSAMLDRLINRSAKTQIQIAAELGYDNANVITMFKKGTTRVPLDKVTALAAALDVDPGGLLRHWFSAYEPAALPEIDKHMGMLMSGSEKSWISGLRKEFGTVPRYEARLAGPIGALVRAH
jgi:transcriptional regulator with XRE-family HTH domain